MKKKDELIIPKIDLDKDFILGMDTSSVIALENSGVKYYDFDGREEDVFKTLASVGINYIRVRIWNNPYDENNNGYGGGNSDLEKAIQIGKRATKYKMKLLVNFHYSDFWCDPLKQKAPKAWEGYSIKEKTKAIYDFTKESLIKIKAEQIEVGMVQVGNETNGKMCGEDSWENITLLMKSGIKAVREILPSSLVALHFTNPEEKEKTSYLYAKELDKYHVDYDVFASSYYPAWHGTIDNLTAVLSNIAEKYHKKVMVMETSYGFTEEDSDYSGNMVSKASEVLYSNEPFTLQGQVNVITSIIDAIKNHTTNGIGVCYWEGTWISVNQKTKEENRILWKKYGSGWTTEYARFYDEEHYGPYLLSEGNAVDNQAFFDRNGKPLPSLMLFKQNRNS